MSEEQENPRLRRRVGGPVVAMAIDLFGSARSTRSWLVLVFILMALVATLAAFVGQTVVPWAIYPAL